MKILNAESSEKGSSAVEFALVLPLLLTLLFGTIEFGLLMYDKAVLTNACREGARFGIVKGTPRKTPEEITTVINQYCASNLITFGEAATTIPDNIYVTFLNGSQNFGDDLKVVATYQYSFLFMDNVINALTGGINLGAQSIMKYE